MAVSSYNNLSSVSKTLAARIWNAIKDDKQLCAIIKSEEQISLFSPSDTKLKDLKPKDPKNKDKDEKVKDEKDKNAKPKDENQVSVFLYNITELSSMRNQPQDPNKPPTLLYLNLHYLITPLTQSAEEDQVVLGKIMQTFAETPVLRSSDLQGSLKEDGEDLRITLDTLEIEELSKIWTMIATPYRLCASYTVRPVRINSTIRPVKPIKTERTPVIKTDKIQTNKTTMKGRLTG